MFYSSHPNIFDFVEKLKCIQTNTYLRMRASENELPQSKQEKERITKLKKILEDFRNQIIGREEFVRKMAFKNLPVVNLINSFISEHLLILISF